MAPSRLVATASLLYEDTGAERLIFAGMTVEPTDERALRFPEAFRALADGESPTVEKDPSFTFADLVFENLQRQREKG